MTGLGSKSLFGWWFLLGLVPEIVLLSGRKDDNLAIPFNRGRSI
jgi:hypothetical protein